jgi:hypothetical protein
LNQVTATSEEMQAAFPALLRLPAGAKGPEAGKGRPFWKAWPKPSKGLLEGLRASEAQQKGSNPFEALPEGQYLGQVPDSTAIIYVVKNMYYCTTLMNMLTITIQQRMI